MNKERRAALSAIVSRINGELSSLLADIKSELESLRDEEQEYFDNMPESIQGGEKGQAAEQAVSNMDSAIDAFDSFEIDSLVSDIESASE